MASTTLVKNATLWQWSDVSSTGMKTGRAIPRSWFCVDKGAITVTSTSSGASETEPPADGNFDSVIDAKHQLVIPGLHDAHIHVAMTGESNYFLNLKGCDSINNMVSCLSAHALKYPVSVLPWISGVNWDQTELGRYPTREDLDIACPDRPVFLWRACWHIGVVNTVGLRLAKLMLRQPIEGSAPDKAEEETLNESLPGGVIDKDDQGIPTGILRERAVELIVAVMGKKSPQDTLRFISEGLRLCSSVGLTSVQANDACSLAVYENLREEGSLPLRVFLTPNYEEIVAEVPSVRGDNTSASDEQRLVHPYRPQCMPRSTATSQVLDSYVSVPSGDQNRIDFSTPESRLIVERLKIYADGSLGAETAAMKIPVVPKAELLLAGNVDTADGSDSVHGLAAAVQDAAVDATVKLQHTGILSHSNDDLVRMVNHARWSGLRVEVHAIGDAAAEQVIDAFEAAGVLASERPVLTHCQVLSSSLIDRMASGGVIANVQPSFVPTDMRWVQQRLTPAQQQYSYAWKTMLDRGVCVAGGSDAPIESCSPFLGMFDAIFRQARSAHVDEKEEGEGGDESTIRNSAEKVRDVDQLSPNKPEVFRPEEALSFAEALWIYTVGAAYAAGCETFLGSLEVGYAADFVIVDAAVLDDNALLATMKPDTVVVGGIISNSRVAAPSDGPLLLCSEVAMAGPYIPGKNGQRPGVKENRRRAAHGALGRLSDEPMPLQCACRLLGRYCAATYS